MENGVVNLTLKYVAAGGLIGSLFYLVLTGKIQASDYQTLAVGALGALGGFHAGSTVNSQGNTANPTQPPKEG